MRKYLGFHEDIKICKIALDITEPETVGLNFI